MGEEEAEIGRTVETGDDLIQPLALLETGAAGGGDLGRRGEERVG